MLNWSSAVTVKLKALPAVALDAALTEKCVAAAATTEIELLAPAIELVLVSVAVIVWLPAVSSVAPKVPVPLLSVLSAGRLNMPALVVKCTVVV